MTESMIERVAKVLEEKLHEDGPSPEGSIAIATAVIMAMREPTDFQRNKYYELSGNTEVMMDAHWERAIDAALIWPAGSADRAGVPLARD